MKNGATPLVLATYRNNADMVELLRSRGARAGQGSVTARQQMLQRFDADGDGILSPQERMAARRSFAR
jgi:ankyrin repeat protein